MSSFVLHLCACNTRITLSVIAPDPEGKVNRHFSTLSETCERLRMNTASSSKCFN